MKATAGVFQNVTIPAKIQRAASVVIDGQTVGRIIDPKGSDGYILAFDFGGIYGMCYRHTITECEEEAEKFYARIKR